MLESVDYDVTTQLKPLCSPFTWYYLFQQLAK